MVNLDIYTDPSRDAVQALRSNIVEVVEVEVEVISICRTFQPLKA